MWKKLSVPEKCEWVEAAKRSYSVPGKVRDGSSGKFVASKMEDSMLLVLLSGRLLQTAARQVHEGAKPADGYIKQEVSKAITLFCSVVTS